MRATVTATDPGEIAGNPDVPAIDQSSSDFH
jgi:hypothetical protein